MLLFHHQNAGQNRDVRITISFSENVSWFKDLSNNSNKSNFDSEGNYEEISGNACYHSVQNLLPSHLLSKNVKIRIYKTINLLVVCMGAKLGL
jgi:hypothetical protein